MFQWIRAQWRVVVIAAFAVAMTLGLVAGGVLAQTPPSTTPTPTTPGTPARPAPSAIVTEFFNKLAGKLNLPPDRVITAAKEVQKEQIDAEVAAGRLTSTLVRSSSGVGPVVLVAPAIVVAPALAAASGWTRRPWPPGSALPPSNCAPSCMRAPARA
jgi:hypothetical protein